MTIAWISPSLEASEQQDLPSPGEGEDFRRRRRLDKSWEKYGVGFFATWSLPYKGGPQTMPEGPKTPGGAPRGWARHPGSWAACWPPGGPLQLILFVF